MKHKETLRRFFQGVWPTLRRFLTHNLGLKLLSVVFALFLWSYVISSSPSITREKTLTDIDITVSGQAVLSSRGLALVTDLGQLGEARVRLKVAQSSFSQATSDSVRVELDLSSIRSAGNQSVKLRGSSVYGSVVQVQPEYLDLEVESQDQRYVPVNVQITGKDEASYWYNVNRVNPSQITVTGPTSLIQNVSSALTTIDVTGRTEPHNRVEKCVLLDAQGNELSGTLSRSTSSVTVGLDIYPVKTVPILSDLGRVVSGQIADGYRITGVEISPASVRVAAERSLLDGLDSLTVANVPVDGASESFTALAAVNAVKGIKHLSSSEVSVMVELSEQELTKNFSNVTVRLKGLGEGKIARLRDTRVEAKVTGAYTQVQRLARSELTASVDLTNLAAGEYELPLKIAADNYPELRCEATPETIRLTISDQIVAAPAEE